LGCKLNNLELATLKRYCDKYGLDYYEIDDTLTYWENKKHLRSLVRMIERSLDAFELARWESLQEQYMKEHFLQFYLLCQMAGETKSAKVGQPENPNPNSFSLETYIQSR